MPDKDSPFWPILRETLRVTSWLVFGFMIYDKFEANKDLLYLFLAGLTSGGITTVTDLLSRRNEKQAEAKREDDKKNEGP